MFRGRRVWGQPEGRHKFGEVFCSGLILQGPGGGYVSASLCLRPLNSYRIAMDPSSPEGRGFKERWTTLQCF